MKKYYLHNGGEQQGPFNLDELKARGLNSETQIWYEGLANWEKAKDIPELKRELSSSNPPPLQTASQTVVPPPLAIKNIQNSKKTKTTLISITAILIVAIIALFMIFKTRTAKDNAFTEAEALAKAKTIAKAKMDSLFNAASLEMTNAPDTERAEDVKAKIEADKAEAEAAMMQAMGEAHIDRDQQIYEDEKDSPWDYLKTSGTYAPNVLGTKYNLHVVINNNAQFVEYKDVVMEVTYYTATKSVISTESFVVYEYFELNSKKEFDIKVPIYEGTASINWQVKSAKIK